MILVLDATVAGSQSNSYETVDEATVLLDGRLNTEPWYTPEVVDGPTAALQASWRHAALVMATRLMTIQVAWYGTPLTVTQALPWPMHGQVDLYGRPVDPYTLPLVIRQAEAFYALALLRDSSESVEASAYADVQSERVGDVQIVYRARTASPSPLQRMPDEIRQMLRPYGRIAGSVMVPLVRT